MAELRPNNNTIWEQKISNELIYERNFLLEMPIMPVLNPALIDNIANEKYNSKTFLSLSDENELIMANYWYYYIYKNKKGLNTKGRVNIRQHSLKYLLKKFNNKKPWLEGINKNIQYESFLQFRNRQPLNRDCIPEEEMKQINKQNLIANIKLIEDNNNIYPLYTPRWFNNKSI